MSLERIPLCLAVLLFGVSGLAAAPETPGVPAPAANGRLSIRLHWDGALPVPARALVACRARVIPLAPAGGPVIAHPAEVSLLVPGSAGQCALEIPLAWRGEGAPVQFTVLYQMEAITPAGKMVRSGSQTIGISAAPGSGTQLTIQI